MLRIRKMESGHFIASDGELYISPESWEQVTTGFTLKDRNGFTASIFPDSKKRTAELREHLIEVGLPEVVTEEKEQAA